MSSITHLDIPLLKLIYTTLDLQDRLEFSIINKTFLSIFHNNSRLLDTVFAVGHDCGYYRGEFLYRNIVKRNVISSIVNMNYLSNFRNLLDLNVSQMEFLEEEQEEMNAYLVRLPPTLLLSLSGIKSQKSFLRNKIEEPNKRTSSIETPSCGVSAWYDERLRGLTLYKTRITYAYHHLQESIPKEILQQLYLDAVTQCRAVVNQIPFGKDAVPTSNSEIEDVERLKNLFIHSILQSQQCNWLFITKVKIVCRKAKYIHRVNDPNALVISKHDVRSEEISWYETRFMYNKFEVTATGGYCNNDSINNDVCSFSGKEAPEHMGRDTQFILLSPVVAAKTTSQPKNFRKKSKSNKWMFQSVLFSG